MAVDRRRRRSHRSNRRSHRNADPALGRRSHGRRSLRVSEPAARVRLVCPRVSGASVAPRYRQPEPAHERRALFARDLSVLHDRRGSAALPARHRGRTSGDQRRDPDRPLCVLGSLGLRRLTRAILDVVSGDALDRFIAARRERFTEELRELCAIPCEASDHTALDAAARWCRDRLAAAGFADARELRAGGAPALVVGETGSGKRVLVGVQHYDVQPGVPLDLWKSPPYEPALRDGAMYARGVDDNKGHLLLRIQAIEAHRAVFGELPIRVRFLIEGEEESGSPNLARLLAVEPGLTDGDGALKEGGALDSDGRPILSLGGKGILYCHFRVRTMSRDAHSGGATHYPNAAWRLAHALASLMDERGRVRIAGFYDDVRRPTDAERRMVAEAPFEPQAMKEILGIERFAFGRGDEDVRYAAVFEPTCNVCGIESGYNGPGSKTVIPCEATAKVDFRLVPDQDPMKIATLLRAHLDPAGFADRVFTAEEGEHPYRGPSDAPLVP